MRQVGQAITVCAALAMTSCSWRDAVAYGERNYAAAPLFDSKVPNPFSYPVGMPGTNSEAVPSHDYAQVAYVIRNRSDELCNKYKLDLALSQTGDNFIADAFNVILGGLGGVVGGGTAQVTSALTSGITGIKNAITSDIYQKVTDIVSNYIDTSRDEQWLTINKKLRSKSYSSEAEVFNDLLIYHNRCSLSQALATAQKESANKKVDADKDVAQSTSNAAVAPATDPASKPKPSRK